MIRTLDRYWFRLLGKVHGRVVRWAEAHCRREKLRRFRHHMAWQKSRMN